MRPAVLVGLVVAAAVAGCAEPDGDPNDQDAAPAVAAGVEFDTCVGWMFVGRIPGDWVQARLPPGYEVFSGMTLQGVPVELPGTAPVAVHAYECEAVTGPAGGREENVRIAFTSVYLESAGERDLADAADFYVFEVFLDTSAAPLTTAHVASVDWPLIDAQVDVDAGSFHIVAGETDYRLLNDDPTTDLQETMSEFDRFERYHHAGRSASYGQLGDKEFRNFGTNQARLEVRGGFFGELRPHEAVPFTGPAQGVGFDGFSTLELADP